MRKLIILALLFTLIGCGQTFHYSENKILVVESEYQSCSRPPCFKYPVWNVRILPDNDYIIYHDYAGILKIGDVLEIKKKENR